MEAGTSLVLRNLTVKNDGWVPTPLSEVEAGSSTQGGGVPEAISIRGFVFDKKSSHNIRVTEGERYV